MTDEPQDEQDSGATEQVVAQPDTPPPADTDSDTAPPATDPDTGQGLIDGYPINELTRAQALHAADETVDPAGIVTPQDITASADIVLAPTDPATLDIVPLIVTNNVPDWKPAVTDPTTGAELVGSYPLAGPARAIALVAAHKTTDPDNILTPDEIAAFAPAT